MMLKRILPAVSLAVLATTTLAGCGGAERPSAEEIGKAFSKSIGEDTVTKEQSDCIGKVFYDSDISDDTLAKVVEEDQDLDKLEVPEKDKEIAESDEFLKDVAGCVTPEGMEMPETEMPDGSEMPDEGMVTPEDQPIE